MDKKGNGVEAGMVNKNQFQATKQKECGLKQYEIRGSSICSKFPCPS